MITTLLLKISRFVPVPMFGRYGRPGLGRFTCLWIHFRGQAIWARHWGCS